MFKIFYKEIQEIGQKSIDRLVHLSGFTFFKSRNLYMTNEIQDYFVTQSD